MPNILHSRKAFFSVRCHDRGLEQQIVDRLVGLRQQRVECIIVSPDVDASGEHPASASANTSVNNEAPPSPVVTLPLANVSRPGRGVNIAHLDWIDVNSTESDNDEDDEYTVENLSGAVNNIAHSVYQFDVYMEFDVARGMTSPRWALNLFLHGRPMPSVVAVSVPRTLEDNVIVTYLLRPHVIHGTPTIDRSATLNLLKSKFHKKEHECEVKDTIDRYYHAPFISTKAKQEIFATWRNEADIPPTPRRLQARRCSIPDELRRELPDEWMHPFISGDGPRFQWVEQHIGRPSNRRGYKTLVLFDSGSRTGKTHWARSLGPHIYMLKTLNHALIHDCVNDGIAQYIVLDDIPWAQLFNESSIGPALLGGQSEYSWKHGKEHMTTSHRLPIIVLNNHAPTNWGNKGKAYWKTNLEIIKLGPGLLYDESVTVDEPLSSALASTLPSAPRPHPPSSSAPTPSQVTLKREEKKRSLPMDSASAEPLLDLSTSGSTAAVSTKPKKKKMKSKPTGQVNTAVANPSSPRM